MNDDIVRFRTLERLIDSNRYSSKPNLRSKTSNFIFRRVVGPAHKLVVLRNRNNVEVVLLRRGFQFPNRGLIRCARKRFELSVCKNSVAKRGSLGTNFLDSRTRRRSHNFIIRLLLNGY